MNNVVVFAVTLCCLTTVHTIRPSSAEDEESFEKRGSPGGMWFGPRLGKRSFQNDYPMQRLLMDAIASSSQDFSNGSKRRLTPRLGRDSSEQEKSSSYKNIDFIPRLGREILYDLYGRALADDRTPTITESRVPPFAPRLGRELFQLYNSNFAKETSRNVRSAESKPSENGKQ